MLTEGRFLSLSATIEISGISSAKTESSDPSIRKDLELNQIETKQNNISVNNQSAMSEENELDESNTECVYVENLVEILRPDNYSSRGFGFLLNSGQSNNNTIAQAQQLIVFNKNNEQYVTTNESYAQIVVVEPGNYSPLNQTLFSSLT